MDYEPFVSCLKPKDLFFCEWYIALKIFGDKPDL